MSTLEREGAIAPSQANIWIVIPAYRERRRLGATLQGLLRHYPNVVVVDDGCPEGTGDVALQHNVWVLRHITNCGQGAALQTGIDFAILRGAQLIVTFDADGQHEVTDVARLVAPILAGEADVVLGSRFLGSTVGMPRSRWLLLKLAVIFTRLFSRIRVTDTHNGLRALSRYAAQSIRITLNRMEHASEILDQIRVKQLRFLEIPVTIRYSEATLQKGQSSWNSMRILGKLFLARIIR